MAAAKEWFLIGNKFIDVHIAVRPCAGRRGVIKLDHRGLVMALTSPPEKGKANDELVGYLARELKVARSAITIIRGETSRQKTVRIEPCDPSAVVVSLGQLSELKAKAEPLR